MTTVRASGRSMTPETAPMCFAATACRRFATAHGTPLIMASNVTAATGW